MTGIERFLDCRSDNVYCHLVVTSLRDNHVGIPLARLDELEEHRLYRARIALNHGLHGLSAFDDVPCHHAHQSVVIVGIDENLDVHLIPEFGTAENQNALHNYDLSRVYGDGLGLAPRSGDVGIDRLFDRPAGLELLKMTDKKVKVN